MYRKDQMNEKDVLSLLPELASSPRPPVAAVMARGCALRRRRRLALASSSLVVAAVVVAAALGVPWGVAPAPHWALVGEISSSYGEVQF